MPLAIFPRDHLAEAGWRGREALAGYDALIARLLKGCGVFSLKTVGGLSERQRAQIAAVLADSGARSSAATRGASGVSVGPV